MQQALKSHNGALLLQVKQERVNHLALQRSDRIAYYTQREAARSPVREVRTLRMRLSVRLSQSCAFPCAPCPQVGDTLTLIIDKMDSAKNLCPTFTTRFPKDVDESIVKNLLTLHLVGVIIHGQPDRRYMYAASQHLPGDTALNIQAICKALTHHLAGKGFRDKLYIQVDNASVRISPLTHPLHVSHLWPSASQDNKSRYMLGFLGFLVAEGYVLQVELSMLMVGHTHEGTLLCTPHFPCALPYACVPRSADIDQAFAVISDELKQRRVIKTIPDYFDAIRSAWKNPDNPPVVGMINATLDFNDWLDPHTCASQSQPT